MINTLNLPPDDYLTELGRLIGAWSKVEHFFQMLFLSIVVMRGAKSVTLDANAQKLMANSFGRQLKGFRTRIDELELSSETRATTLRIVSQLDTLRKERDRAAHSQLWAQFHEGNIEKIDEETATQIFKSWKNTDKFEWTDLTKTRLTEICQRIVTLHWDLVKLGIDPEIIAQKPRQSW
jgi:hypothetical protein